MENNYIEKLEKSLCFGLKESYKRYVKEYIKYLNSTSYDDRGVFTICESGYNKEKLNTAANDVEKSFKELQEIRRLKRVKSAISLTGDELEKFKLFIAEISISSNLNKEDE